MTTYCCIHVAIMVMIKKLNSVYSMILNNLKIQWFVGRPEYKTMSCKISRAIINAYRCHYHGKRIFAFLFRKLMKYIIFGRVYKVTLNSKSQIFLWNWINLRVNSKRFFFLLSDKYFKNINTEEFQQLQAAYFCC